MIEELCFTCVLSGKGVSVVNDDDNPQEVLQVQLQEHRALLTEGGSDGGEQTATHTYTHTHTKANLTYLILWLYSGVSPAGQDLPHSEYCVP